MVSGILWYEKRAPIFCLQYHQRIMILILDINNEYLLIKSHNFIWSSTVQSCLKIYIFCEKKLYSLRSCCNGWRFAFFMMKNVLGLANFWQTFFLAYSKTVWMARRQCNRRPPCCCSEFWSFKIHLHFDAIQVVHYSHQLLTLFFLNDLMVSDLRMNGFEKVVDDWFEYWI